MKTVRYTSEEMDKLPDTTDWERVKNMSDDEIDFSDIPELTDEMASRMVHYTNGELLEKHEGKDGNSKSK
jgi:hypothetical protein